MLGITPSARLRPSPFHEVTLAEGVTSFTVYNRMLMPTGYGKPEEEYWRLICGVSQWDVAVERQVQLAGPDAARLAQLLCPRDLSKQAIGQDKYVALCNHDGALINDPILLKLADDRFWLSIADSNIWFWARAIAAEGPRRRQMGVLLDGNIAAGPRFVWYPMTRADGTPIGSLNNCVWSWRLQRNIGFALVASDCAAGDAVAVSLDGTHVTGQLVELPFI